MPQIQDCKRELRYLLSKPRAQETHVEVSAGELHQRVFGESSDDTPVCCAAMRSEFRDGDSVVAGSDDKHSATFTVRYALPRPVPVVPADAQD